MRGELLVLPRLCPTCILFGPGPLLLMLTAWHGSRTHVGQTCMHDHSSHVLSHALTELFNSQCCSSGIQHAQGMVLGDVAEKAMLLLLFRGSTLAT